MVYNNREYPHPILGIKDDIEGKFEAYLSVKAGKDTIKIETIFELDNEDINLLIKNSKAIYTVQVYCKSTMFREVYKFNKSVSEKIIIPTSKLRDEVELHFFICATEDLLEYTNSQTHEDFGNTIFSINKGEILAYGGKGLFNANKTPEELKSVSSFMQIESYDQKTGPIKNFYDGSKVTIQLSLNDFDKYTDVAGNKYSEQLLHSAVVLPALMDAIQQINKNTGEFENHNWYIMLQKLIDEKSKGNDNPLTAGQKILDNPINRTFKTMNNLINYQD